MYEGGHVAGVFSTQEAAEAYAKAHDLHAWDVDEYEVDELCTTSPKPDDDP